MMSIHDMQRLTGILAMAVILLAGGAGRGQDLEAVLKDLESPDGGRRSAAAEKVQELGARAVAPLAKLLESQDRSTQVAAKVGLTNLTHHAARPEAAKERGEVARALVAAYGGSSAAARNVLAEDLSLIGGDESVAALAARLADPACREMARFALARIPAPSAAEALRKALKEEKDPAFQVALINALGARRDEGAEKLITAHLDSKEDEVRLAAIEALSRMGTAGDRLKDLLAALPSAGDAAKARARLRVRDALVILGESLLAAGKHEPAGKLYQRLLEAAADSNEKSAAIVGLGRAGGEGALEAIQAALKGDSDDVRAAGYAALAAMPSPKGVQAIEKLSKDADPDGRVRLLTALAHSNDPQAASLAARSLGDSEANVRKAALVVLEGSREPAAAQALLKAIQSGGPVAQEGAVGVLGRMPGDAATRAIADASRSAKGETQVNLLRALGQRRGGEVEKILLEAARSDNVAVQAAGFEGLANLGSREAIPILLAALGAEGKGNQAAEKALSRMVTPENTGNLIESARKKGGAHRAAILRILGKREIPEVLPLLLEGAKDPEEEVRVAALEGLSVQRDVKVMPVLLEAAESGPEKVRPAAVLGCLRFGQAIEEKDRAAALNVYHKALSLARRKEEKVQALTGIFRLADPSSIPVVKPLLEDKDKALQQAAAVALLPIAAKLGDDRKDEALAIIKQALPMAPSSPGARAAVEKLRSLGVDYDMARESGFITRWLIVGPFASPDNKLFANDVLDPDAVRPAEGGEVKAGGETRKWKAFHSAEPQGVIDLEQAVGRLDNVAAYAYTEVTVEADKRASFKMGSDDSIVVWVNGKKAHEMNASRALTIDQDVVNVRLMQGKNRILVKVLNGASQWAFCLRVTDRQGAPLKVAQEEK